MRQGQLLEVHVCLEPAQRLDIYNDWLRFRISTIIQVTLATNAQLLGYFHPDTYFVSSLAESKINSFLFALFAYEDSMATVRRRLNSLYALNNAGRLDTSRRTREKRALTVGSKFLYRMRHSRKSRVHSSTA